MMVRSKTLPPVAQGVRRPLRACGHMCLPSGPRLVELRSVASGHVVLLRCRSVAWNERQELSAPPGGRESRESPP
jgi:hypothetical protein